MTSEDIKHQLIIIITAVEWLIQALEGYARREVLTHAAGEADTAAQVLAFFAATFGDHRDLHAAARRQRQMCIRDRRQGMKDKKEVVGQGSFASPHARRSCVRRRGCGRLQQR